jgi:hypothetical protein
MTEIYLLAEDILASHLGICFTELFSQLILRLTRPVLELYFHAFLPKKEFNDHISYHAT